MISHLALGPWDVVNAAMGSNLNLIDELSITWWDIELYDGAIGYFCCVDECCRCWR